MDSETKLDTARAVAGTAVGTGGFIVTADMVIACLTIIYLLASLGLLIPKYVDWYKSRREKHDE
jgi:hypothetical protein